MDRVLALFGETIAGSAETVAQAADERQRAEGLVEAPNGHAARAALLRERLRTAHAEASEQLSADDAKVLRGLAREVLGGIWSTLWDDYSTARDEAAAYVRENRASYARRGMNWAWGVLGRSLGVGAPETY